MYLKLLYIHPFDIIKITKIYIILAPCILQSCAANSYCVNKPFYAICKCNSGFNGNGKIACYECGVIFHTDNVLNSRNRIVGGIEAIPHSFPFAVLIFISYK